jgi:hypothetical protein
MDFMFMITLGCSIPRVLIDILQSSSAVIRPNAFVLHPNNVLSLLMGGRRLLAGRALFMVW